MTTEKQGQEHQGKTEKSVASLLNQQQEPNLPQLKLSRVWAMPSRHTFTIKPIRELLERYVGRGMGWVDPFAGEYSPALFTNDLNPRMPTADHMHANDYVKLLPKGLPGILWDPPYSPRQIRECYDGIGIKGPKEDFQYLGRLKRLYAEHIRLGGLAICCGWNSGGFGKTLGFELLEVLLVPHGKDHNDTIVTVERRVA